MGPNGWQVTMVNSGHHGAQLVSFTPCSDFNDFGNSVDPSSDTVHYTPREAESHLRLRCFPPSLLGRLVQGCARPGTALALAAGTGEQ